MRLRSLLLLLLCSCVLSCSAPPTSQGAVATRASESPGAADTTATPAPSSATVPGAASARAAPSRSVDELGPLGQPVPEPCDCHTTLIVFTLVALIGGIVIGRVSRRR